ISNELETTVDVPKSGRLCIRIATEGVPAGRFTFGGETILQPSDFHKDDEFAEARFDVDASTYDLHAWIAPNPKASAKVSVSFAASSGGAPVASRGDGGLLVVENLRHSPQPFAVPADEALEITFDGHFSADVSAPPAHG